MGSDFLSEFSLFHSLFLVLKGKASSDYFFPNSTKQIYGLLIPRMQQIFDKTNPMCYVRKISTYVHGHIIPLVRAICACDVTENSTNPRPKMPS